jgi:hypothetical protein
MTPEAYRKALLELRRNTAMYKAGRITLEAWANGVHSILRMYGLE